MGRALSIVALVTLAAAPLHAAGFSIFEQGSKAMGMAGAFTAQADDPSALFYNAGGLAFVDKQEFSIGDTYIHATKAELRGRDPFVRQQVRDPGRFGDLHDEPRRRHGVPLQRQPDDVG